MAMKIRLARGGSKKRPFYRIVAADSRMPRDGRFIERLGTYNPLLPKDSEERVKMNVERIQEKVPFKWKADVWYTIKLQVKVEGEKARVLGKVWKRGDPEPDAWTIEQVDPHANKQGSPGLYLYALSETYFDNVSVTKGK